MAIQDINLTAISWWKEKSLREKYTIIKRCYPDFTGEVTYDMIKRIHETVANELPERKYTKQEVDEMLDAQAARTADQLLKNFLPEESVRKLINKFASEFAFKIVTSGLVTQQDMVKFEIDWVNKHIEE